MEIKSVEQLIAFLETLSTSGVEEFEGFGFHVRFASTMFTPERMIPPAPEYVMPEREEEGPRNMWEDPNLWAGGKRPEFPK